MQLGQVVDYCIEYNKRQKEMMDAVKEDPQKKTEKKAIPRKRRATQGDIDAWLG